MTVTIQLEHVINYDIELETSTDSEDALVASPIELIDCKKFIELFKQKYPNQLSSEQILVFWHNLFGNHPISYDAPSRPGEAISSETYHFYDKGNIFRRLTPESKAFWQEFNGYDAWAHRKYSKHVEWRDTRGENPNYHYLTPESAAQILEYFTLFQNGIDFEHLPAGFLVEKNPKTGIMDVLHFGEFYKKAQKRLSPFAVTLSPKSNLLAENPFKEALQAKWYAFFLTKAPGYCTLPELHQAFTALIKIAETFHLNFYEPDFSDYEEEFNPIIILGRFASLMTNPFLFKEDRQLQWESLFKLPLIKSYQAIRALTDYQNTTTPCTCLLPEMELQKTLIIYQDGVAILGDTANACLSYDAYKVDDIRMGDNIWISNGEAERYTYHEWRFLAYQPKRYSMSFYKEARALVPDSLYSFAKYAITTTTGINNSDPNAEEAQALLWQEIMNTYNEVNSLIYRAGNTLGSDIKGQFSRELLKHFDSLEKANLQFFSHLFKKIVSCIDSNLLTIGPRQINLILKSSEHDHLVFMYGQDFFLGAKFYWQDKDRDIYDYIDLQGYLNKKDSPFVEYLTPLLSTFALFNESDIDSAIENLNSTKNLEALQYALKVFKDAQKSLSSKSLKELCKLIDELPVNPNSMHQETLEKLEEKYTPYFPKDYFKEQKEFLIDATLGKNREIEASIAACRFPRAQQKILLELQLGLFREQPFLTIDQFRQLNLNFATLKRLVTPGDFKRFITQLARLQKASKTVDFEELSNLINYLIINRGVDSFTQIAICNQKEPCKYNALKKMLFFIQNISPLSFALDLGLHNRINLQETLARLVLNSRLNDENDEQQCMVTLQKFSNAAEEILKSHPSLSRHLFKIFTTLPNKEDTAYFSNLNQQIDTMLSLSILLAKREDDQLTLFSLLAHFNDKPLLLKSFWESVQGFTLEQQIFIWKFISQVKDNNQSLADMEDFLKILKEDDHLNVFSKCCQTPPYANLPLMSQWLTEKTFAESYNAFSCKPFGERKLHYAFTLDDFNRQKKLFTLMEDEANPFLIPGLGEELEQLLGQNRSKTVLELQLEFKALRDNYTLEKDLELLALCVEMLSRTASQLEHGENPISQELNATQVMTLLAMIRNPHSNLISEIDTGEGKSRITIVLAAFLAAKGKTVDLITSDLSLALRDYLKYQSFFTALGLKTSLIDLNTPKTLYQKGGINFSDNGQLLLLRNKSDINLSPTDYRDINPSNRALILDEADKFIHDKSKDSYNFAITSPALKDLVWIYPLLVDFVDKKRREIGTNLVIDKTLKEEFISYVTTIDLDPSHQEKLGYLAENNLSQLLTWLSSANKALDMVPNVDYKVTEDDEKLFFPVRGPDGHTQYSRLIRVLDNGQIAEGSTFSNGVHQCLCAIENKKSESEDFVIQPENTTQCARFAKAFLNEYQQGQLFGVSGTTRSDAPKAKKEINHANYHYLKVPRHKVLRRDDKNIWPARNEKQQFEFIKRIILEKLQKSPAEPVLLICKDDKNSKLVFDAIKADEEISAIVKNLTRIESLSEKEEQVAAIDAAGRPGSLTVSTVGMFGRGVDIHAEHLTVLTNYIPTLADEKQIQGRTARAGKPGEYRMILNLKDKDYSLKGKMHNIEAKVREIQKQNAFSAIFQEEIGNLYAEFLEDVTQAFLTQLAAIQKTTIQDTLIVWQEFLNAMQKDWVEQSNPLLLAFENKNEEAFKETFQLFVNKWLKKLNEELEVNLCFRETLLEKTLTGLTAHHGFFNEKKLITTKRQAKYDPADDGQARIYDSVFEPIAATFRGERPFFADFRAWLDGRGELFPDLMATIHGERPLFVHLREWIAALIQTIASYFTEEKIDEENNEIGGLLSS